MRGSRLPRAPWPPLWCAPSSTWGIALVLAVGWPPLQGRKAGGEVERHGEVATGQAATVVAVKWTTEPHTKELAMKMIPPRWPGGRGRHQDAEGQLDAVQALDFLHPDLRACLASLHGAPVPVAEATVQLLPFGSRAALETLEPPLAVAGRPVDDEGHRDLKLTPFAYEVMAAAAAQAEAKPEVIDDWTARAQRATQTVVGGDKTDS